MNNNEEALLKIDHLCQYFRMGQSELKAVDDVSFEVKKGEVFGLVGESGCGKTMTAMSVMRLLPKSAFIKSGEILFNGENLLDYKESYLEKQKVVLIVTK